MSRVVDVIVIGGGMVGAAVASLLGKIGFSVELVDASGAPAWDETSPVGLRVSALSPGSEAVLAAAGAWQTVRASRHCPYRRMHVEDGQGRGALDFEAAIFGFDHLGTIVENDLVTHALWQALTLDSAVTPRAPRTLASLEQDGVGVRCTLDDGQRLEGKLLIGCDGAGSIVRRIAGIDTDHWAYNQKGLVTRVRKTEANPGVAWQRFLPGGPLAFLPLADGASSIVWTLPSREADALCDASEADFAERLALASEGWLGAVEEFGRRAAFPLAMNLGRQTVAGRVVLLGDAAHAVHPLAGQGVNLGFADAAALVEVLAQARAAGRDLADPDDLARFERWRRSEASLMAQGIHALGSLFRPATLSPLRAVGMGLVGRSWTLREAFLRRAAGVGPNAPALARGQKLAELART